MNTMKDTVMPPPEMLDQGVVKECVTGGIFEGNNLRTKRSERKQGYEPGEHERAGDDYKVVCTINEI